MILCRIDSGAIGIGEEADEVVRGQILEEQPDGLDDALCRRRVETRTVNGKNDDAPERRHRRAARRDRTLTIVDADALGRNDLALAAVDGDRELLGTQV